jgi:hypothetical protein
MDGDELRDDQFDRLKELVPGGCKGKRGPRTDNRRFLNALLWMAGSGGDGVTCLPGLGIIIQSRGAIIAGSRWAFLRPCSKRWRVKPIWNG